MELNLNGIGARRDTLDIGIGGAEQKTADAAKNVRSATNLTIGDSIAGLASAEPVAEIPDDALSRDDALGKLVNSAFNLAPPPMPKFAE